MLRRLITMLTFSLVLGAGAVLAALGPGPFARFLPPEAVASLEGLVGPNGLLGASDRVAAAALPADFLTDGPQGLVASGPIAASAANQPVFIADVLSGHQTKLEQAIPAAVITIRPILGCLLTPPQPGSVVGHVTGLGRGLPMALTSYNDADLALGVAEFVDRYRKRGIAAPVPGGAFAFQAQDVVVTETAARVYLVLENAGGNRIWNIHLAEGARVERVVLLGGAQSGVVNLDPVVPVEVMLADGLAECGIVPAHPLNPGHPLLQAPGAGSKPAPELAARIEAAASYDIWFRDSFGVLASATRVGFDGGTVAVVGPVPGPGLAKADYAPISGADIRTTQDIYFEIAGQVPQGQDYGNRVMALATSLAMGDLALLRQGVGF